MKAVILAGGLGKRLRPLTEDRPKPLVEVCGRPILEWQIRWLKRFGINDFVLLLGHAKQRVLEFLGSGRKLDIRVAYVVEDEPLGTAGAIKNAESVLKNEDVFIVVNGDIITDLDPRPMIETLLKNEKAVAAIALVPMRSPYGVVKVENGYVVEFVEKPILEHLINAGVYAMKPEIFEYLPEKGDIERTTFPKLASERKLLAHVYKEAYWKSIDTVKDLEEAAGMLHELYPDLCKL
ncbi:MAG: nucleotidyltransferase family protein [Crenarchaeota archaeon]|nr:nucleotidyltransferase family protein [Thermoproteota archaeon]